MVFHLLHFIFQNGWWFWITKTGMSGTYVQVYIDKKKHAMDVFQKEKTTDVYT